MATTTEPEGSSRSASAMLCSSWAREQQLDPIGSAGSYQGFLLVEWPLPWPRDLGEDPALAPVAAAARAAGMRLQGLVPAAGGGPRHVIAYRWPQRAGARYERTELLVEPGEVVEAALAIGGEAPSAGETTDLLVCGHGRRDRCCGSLGTVLALEILADPASLADGVRVWRTSHTGGHRFAPTAIVLPQGTAWAFCDRDLLARVVRKHGPLEDVLPRYRGCAGLASAEVQALERAVLGEIGWSLLDLPRRGAPLGEDAVELVVDGPGGPMAWEATVRVDREMPVPDCGSPIELSKKTEPQYVVEGLRRR